MDEKKGLDALSFLALFHDVSLKEINEYF